MGGRVHCVINDLTQKESICVTENYFYWVQTFQNINFSLRIYNAISNDNIILLREQRTKAIKNQCNKMFAVQVPNTCNVLNTWYH